MRRLAWSAVVVALLATVLGSDPVLLGGDPASATSPDYATTVGTAARGGDI